PRQARFATLLKLIHGLSHHGKALSTFRIRRAAWEIASVSSAVPLTLTATEPTATEPTATESTATESTTTATESTATATRRVLVGSRSIGVGVSVPTPASALILPLPLVWIHLAEELAPLLVQGVRQSLNLGLLVCFQL